MGLDPNTGVGLDPDSDVGAALAANRITLATIRCAKYDHLDYSIGMRQRHVEKNICFQYGKNGKHADHAEEPLSDAKKNVPASLSQGRCRGEAVIRLHQTRCRELR